jgi:hypothetical protein
MNIYPLGKSTEIKIGASILVLLVLGFGGREFYTRYKDQKSQLEQAKTELADANVNYTKLKEGIVQAQNSSILTQDQLKKLISSELKNQITLHNQEILAAIKEGVQVKFDENHETGTKTGTTQYTFPVAGKTDPIVDKLVVDTSVPSYKLDLKPFTLNLEATLNYDQKQGVTRFWSRPTAVGLPKGVEATMGEVTFNLDQSFNQWVTSMRGETVRVPEMPKYTVGGLVGVSYVGSAYSPAASWQKIYGVEGTRNFSNNLGIGGGIMGNGVLGYTEFLKLTYSFGKQP